MKVLVVSNLYPPEVIGGYELSCRQVVDGLRSAGHDVRVLTTAPQVPAGPEAHVDRHLRRPDVFSPLRHSSRSEFWELESNLLDSGNVYALISVLEEFRPDVCYLCNLVSIGGAGLVGALEYLGVPWLWHLGDAVPAQLCVFDGAILPIATLMSTRLTGRFLAVSQGLINEIEHVVSLGGRTRLIPNWTVGTEAPLERTYFDGTFLTLAFAGQLNEHKGVYIALDAVAQLRDAGYTQLSLDLYGRGETESVAARIRQLDLTTMVTLRGWTPQDELYRELEHHDLFIFPTWSREPFAIAPLDAGARGCVPLVSSPSGPAEWLVDGVHYLAARRDPTAFASVIRQVLDGEIDLAAIGRRAAALVRSEYTLDRVLPIIEEELEGRVGQGHDPVGTSNELHRMAVIAEAMGRRWVTEASAR